MLTNIDNLLLQIERNYEKECDIPVTSKELYYLFYDSLSHGINAHNSFYDSYEGNLKEMMRCSTYSKRMNVGTIFSIFNFLFTRCIITEEEEEEEEESILQMK